MQRLALFLLAQIAVLLQLGSVASLLGVGHWLRQGGTSLAALLGWTLLIGLIGGALSLLLLRPLARMATGARPITDADEAEHRWLLDVVKRLSSRVGLAPPTLAVYDGPPNLLAVGAANRSALLLVSSGLLLTLEKDEVEALLAHQIGHIASGDMVTLGLLQGVPNTFVVLPSRLISHVVDRMLFKGDPDEIGPTEKGLTWLLQGLCGGLATLVVGWFSRDRLRRADGGAVKLTGDRQPLLRALDRLDGVDPGQLPRFLAVHGLCHREGPKQLAALAPHPPLKQRLQAVRRLRDDPRRRPAAAAPAASAAAAAAATAATAATPAAPPAASPGPRQ